MSPIPTGPRGLFFDEFQPGQQITTIGRTLTEADIVGFAGLSGDFNQIHTDAVYSAKSPAGQRVAHGLLVLSIVSGLAVQTGVLEGTVLFFREIDDWKFIEPVFIGDTVHAIMEVGETKDMRRLGGGTVVIQFNVKNKNDETVMKGSWTVLVAARPR